ncbi:MAG: tRNA lysidine(34) synthetase TilS [Clostridiales bacterium]|nr:tRNA lysidine(34) synthetase TilS [Clostridiales bacterium]
MALSEFARQIYDYCTGKRLLDGVSYIVAGLSGGPDSVALVCVLDELRKEVVEFPEIYAVHVNHGLRNTAGADEDLSAKLCDRMGIPFKVYRFDVSKEASAMGRGLEETGRILRYKAFRDYAMEISRLEGVDIKEGRTATAHHRGDLSETFMMNLFRGSGLDGLTAMASGNDIIRPLLSVSKSQIIDYLNGRGIAYATDETNLQNDYTRNKWRNEILPLIGDASVKAPEEAILDTYRLLSVDEDYIMNEAEKAYHRCRAAVGKYYFIKAYEANGLHPAILTRVVRLYWQEVFGDLIDLETKHVSIITELMRKIGGTRYADMPFGRTAVCAEGLLGLYGEEGGDGLACVMSTFAGFPAAITRERSHISVSELEAGPVTVNYPDFAISVKASVVENEESIVYNTFSWIGPAKDIDIGGYSMDGTFRKAGSAHETGLRKLLSDLKVPRDARDHLMAISQEGRLVWIPGAGHSEGFVSLKSRQLWLKDNDEAGDIRLMRVDITIEEVKVG